MVQPTWNAHPKNHGKGDPARCCRKCDAIKGVIRKYNMMICRRCFREKAAEIGFHKLR